MNEEKLHNSKIILHVFTFPYLRMSPKLMTETSNCNKIFKTHFLFAPVYFENRARERTVIQQVLDLKKEKWVWGEEIEVGEKEKHSKHIQSHAEALIELCR